MKISLAVAAILTVSPMLLAQTPPPMPAPTQVAEWQVDRYTSMLSLTAAQRTQAEALYTAEATSEEKVREQERTAHQAFDAAIQSGDTATIQQAATLMGQLHGEATALRGLADSKFCQTLTADQKAKFAQLPKGPGPGGRPGPMPH